MVRRKKSKLFDIKKFGRKKQKKILTTKSRISDYECREHFHSLSLPYQGSQMTCR
jgi:hypothetical protein